MSRLIVCEKNIAARRIAHILSEGRAKLERIHNVPVYVFHDLPAGRHGGEEQVKCIGLKGHILKVDFPAQYNNWQEIDPIKLIDAPIVKVPTQKSILKALQKVAKDADVAVISTDFDREGELIGIDAVNKIREVNPNIKVKRARFSSLTESEIKRAFSNLEDVYMSLAQAGEARQDIDLIWGATLTRFLSLASSRLGRQFLSVGRVQSPTLSLIADREKKRQEHKPKPYWLVKALFESRGSEQFIARHKIERFWDKLEAEAVLSRLGKMGKVVDISTVRKVLKPPTPFNTTAFLSAAASIGVSPSRAMRIAENLYMEGLISYPRVDNTVYPPSLNFDEILKILAQGELGNLANLILKEEKIIPTRGKTEATDHPPIHPTGLAKREDLKAQEWKIYELVCRRFFGTLAPEASLQSVRIDIESGLPGQPARPGGGEPFFVRGTAVVNEGWLKFYPYGRKKDEEVPTLKRGDELKLIKPILEEKETQPPPRYTQGQLIQKMEALGLGTKCLTGDSAIKIVRDQGIENIKLETLFSSYKYLGEIQYEGERIEVAENNGYKCFSFNGNEIIESEFYGVSRRRLREDEKVYEIFFEDGSSLKATDRHLICVYDGGKFTYVPCCALSSESLVISSTNQCHEKPCLPTGRESISNESCFTWEEFLTLCQRDTPFIGTRLYGRDCEGLLKRKREQGGSSQSEFGNQIGCYQGVLSNYEKGKRDIPLWLLNRLCVKPDQLSGLNKNITISNPFPLKMSSSLSRIFGHLIGDGSISFREAENCYDLRYHNSNMDLIRQFTSDIEEVFGIRPQYKRRKKSSKRRKLLYYVHLPAVVGRIILMIAPEILLKNPPKILTPEFYPEFIGVIFDDEGYVCKSEPKIFISNTNKNLLTSLGSMLKLLAIDSTIGERENKLHIRGRKNLQLFVEKIPFISVEKRRALLNHFVTHYKYNAKLSTPLIEKEIMKSLGNREKTTKKLTSELKLAPSTIQRYIKRLLNWDYIVKVVYGNNKDIPRIIKYRSRVHVHDSFYSMLGGKIIGWNVVTKKVKFIRKVTYNGYVYDILNVNNFSNFVLSNNVVVHNSTRHEIIKNLYDRSYIHGDPIVPTEMGLAVAEALRKHADTISTPQMTAELEKDMDAIAEGKVARESVVDRSRNILARIMLDLGRKKAAVAGEIREGIREDKIIGKCPRCGMDLKIIRAKKSKKRFIGCAGYPECSMAYPLPQYGEIITLDDVCEVCHSPKVKVIGRPPTSRGGKSPKPWILCIDPNCPTKKGSD